MSDSLSRGDSRQIAQVLREQLNEMMAAAQGLEGALLEHRSGHRYLSVLNRGLCRQLRLTRHLELDCRLNNEDEVRLTLRPVDLVDLCRSLLLRVEGLSRFLNVRVTFATALTALPTVADGAMLEEMLLCLISNSLKAIGQDGAVSLSLEQHGSKAVFTLQDNGGGIDAETLASLFYPQDEGEDFALGHGLALSRQIAALHGGVIIVDSQETKGVRLAVSLPLRDLASGGSLCSHRPVLDESGGWDKVLIELADCLPAEAFLPEDLR